VAQSTAPGAPPAVTSPAVAVAAAGRDSRTTITQPTQAARTSVRHADEQAQFYRGKEGRTLPVSVNYMRLEIEEGKGVHEYEVSYEPRVDNRNARFKLLNQHRDGVIGLNKVRVAFF